MKLQVRDSAAPKFMNSTHSNFNILADKLIEFAPDRPYFDERYTLDVNKIKLLGWEPKIKWEQGLILTGIFESNSNLTSVQILIHKALLTTLSSGMVHEAHWKLEGPGSACSGLATYRDYFRYLLK
jgi:hypothetical protein